LDRHHCRIAQRLARRSRVRGPRRRETVPNATVRAVNGTHCCVARMALWRSMRAGYHQPCTAGRSAPVAERAAVLCEGEEASDGTARSGAGHGGDAVVVAAAVEDEQVSAPGAEAGLVAEIHEELEPPGGVVHAGALALEVGPLHAVDDQISALL